MSESSSQRGKPGSSSQQEKLESSGQQRKSRSFYMQEESKNVDHPLKGNVMEIQPDSMNSKNPPRNKKCQSIYKPVCGSDGKTYGNQCVFDQAKRSSNGKLNLKHEGKC
ncbi:serine protease inhibitor Kazal-type 6-like [Marmota flaviventris]